METVFPMARTPLEEADPEVHALIEEERARQRSGIELIASENFTSLGVMQALGSPLTNKYSEGLPGARYYGGNEVIDKVENLCKKRALEEDGEEGRSKSRSKSRSAVMGRTHSSKSRSRSRGPSVSHTAEKGAGFKTSAQKMKAQIISDKMQRKMQKLARKGEGDRIIPNEMPKHLFSGKRGIGKTDRR